MDQEKKQQSSLIKKAVIIISIPKQDPKDIMNNLKTFLSDTFLKLDNQTIEQDVNGEILSKEKSRFHKGLKTKKTYEIFKIIEFGLGYKQKLQNQLLIKNQSTWDGYNLQVQWMKKYLLIQFPKKNEEQIVQYLYNLKIDATKYKIIPLENSNKYNFIAISQFIEDQQELFTQLRKNGIQTKSITQKMKNLLVKLFGIQSIQDSESEYNQKIKKISSQITDKQIKYIQKALQKHMSQMNQYFKKIKQFRKKEISNEAQKAINIINNFLKYHKAIYKSNKRTFVLAIQQIYQGLEILFHELSKILAQQQSSDEMDVPLEKHDIIEEIREKQILSNRMELMDKLAKILGKPQKKYDQQQLTQRMEPKSQGLCAALSKYEIFVYKHKNYDIQQSRQLIRKPYLYSLNEDYLSQIHKDIIQEIRQKIRYIQNLNQKFGYSQSHQFNIDMFENTINDNFFYILCLQNEQDQSDSHDIVVFKKQDTFYLSNCNQFTLKEVTIQQLKLYLEVWKKGPIDRKIRLKKLSNEDKCKYICQQIINLQKQIEISDDEYY